MFFWSWWDICDLIEEKFVENIVGFVKKCLVFLVFFIYGLDRNSWNVFFLRYFKIKVF